MHRNRPRFTGSIDLSGRDDQANMEVAAILAELFDLPDLGQQMIEVAHRLLGIIHLGLASRGPP